LDISHWSFDLVLAHFAFAADVTTLREECRFVRAPGMAVARYCALPFAALSFYGEEPERLRELAAELVAPGEPFYLLLNEQQTRIAGQAFAVAEVYPEWQMLFTGDPAALEVGAAVPLRPDDLPQMRELAAEAGLMALEGDPFRHGPAFGVWEEIRRGGDTETRRGGGGGLRLVAMGGTHLLVPGAAEIGNIATHPTRRRRGLARQVVAALVRAHAAEGRRVFLLTFQSNLAAVRLYERMGFERLRPMSLLRCEWGGSAN